MTESIDQHVLRDLWERALAEDGADRDVTCEVALPGQARGLAHLVGQQPGVFAGRVLLDLLADLYACPRRR